MDYKKLGEEILELVGGEKNVTMLTHCATRLRFEFNDSTKVDKQKIENLPGIISVVDKGGQFQVVVGNEVQQSYRAIQKKLGSKSGEQDKNTGKSKKNENSLVARFISVISTTFTPFIPAIIGAGMIKAILAVLVLLGVLTDQSQTFFILNTVADAAFFFMPVLLAYGASIKFETSPILAMTIAGVLLHPNWANFLASGESLYFVGVPVRLTDYAGSVLPIIITVWIMSYIERFAEKVSPSIIKFFMKPMLILLITAPLSLVVIGPIGTYLNDIVALTAESINNYASWLIPMLMGTLQPFLILTGTAWAMTPIATSQLSNYGFEMMNGPGMLASNIAQGGATLAVAVKSKNKQLKQLASSAGFTAVIGITEPALYGVTLKLKKPLIASMIGGGIAGIYAGISGLVRYAFVSPGLAAIPAFIGENPMNIIHALITIAIAFTVGFIASWLLGFEDPVEYSDNDTSQDENESNQQESKEITGHITSPMIGTVTDLKEVNDEVFSSGLIGKGVAIMPTKGEVRAPFNGEILTLFPSKHAIGLRSDNGIELLIHIGIDTVNLNGEYFTSHVKQGDSIKKGDLLITFDQKGITDKGYDIITPMIITNDIPFNIIDNINGKDVNVNDTILNFNL